MSAELTRHDRRRLRKAILAEARRIGALDFGCSRFVVEVCTGRVVGREPRWEYRHLSWLLHLCAQLDGRVPPDRTEES